MNYYERATNILAEWIEEVHMRENDFFDRQDLEEHETIRQYMSRNAYKHNIITEIIDYLLGKEKERLLSKIYVL